MQGKEADAGIRKLRIASAVCASLVGCTALDSSHVMPRAAIAKTISGAATRRPRLEVINLCW